MKCVPSAAVVFVMLAGCASTANPATSAHRAPTPSSVPAVTTPASAPTYRVGDTIAGPAGDRFTLHAVVFPSVASVPDSIRSNHHPLWSADVEACAGPAGLEFNPLFFSLAPDPTGNRGMYLWGMAPQLEAVTLVAGSCSRGWVTLEVPDGPPPTLLVYSHIGSQATALLSSATVNWQLQ